MARLSMKTVAALSAALLSGSPNLVKASDPAVIAKCASNCKNLNATLEATFKVGTATDKQIAQLMQDTLVLSTGVQKESVKINSVRKGDADVVQDPLKEATAANTTAALMRVRRSLSEDAAVVIKTDYTLNVAEANVAGLKTTIDSTAFKTLFVTKMKSKGGESGSAFASLASAWTEADLKLKSAEKPMDECTASTKENPCGVVNAVLSFTLKLGSATDKQIAQLIQDTLVLSALVKKEGIAVNYIKKGTLPLVREGRDFFLPVGGSPSPASSRRSLSTDAVLLKTEISLKIALSQVADMKLTIRGAAFRTLFGKKLKEKGAETGSAFASLAGDWTESGLAMASAEKPLAACLTKDDTCGTVHGLVEITFAAGVASATDTQIAQLMQDSLVLSALVEKAGVKITSLQKGSAAAVKDPLASSSSLILRRSLSTSVTVKTEYTLSIAKSEIVGMKTTIGGAKAFKTFFVEVMKAEGGKSGSAFASLAAAWTEANVAMVATEKIAEIAACVSPAKKTETSAASDSDAKRRTLADAAATEETCSKVPGKLELTMKVGSATDKEIAELFQASLVGATGVKKEGVSIKSIQKGSAAAVKDPLAAAAAASTSTARQLSTSTDAVAIKVEYELSVAKTAADALTKSVISDGFKATFRAKLREEGAKVTVFSTLVADWTDASLKMSIGDAEDKKSTSSAGTGMRFSAFLAAVLAVSATVF